MEIAMKRFIPFTLLFLCCAYPYKDVVLNKAYLYEDGVQSPTGDIKTEIISGYTLSHYNDSLISLDWYPGSSVLLFGLSNQTNYFGNILWNDVTFWNTDSTCSRIFHNRIPFIDVEKEMARQIILPKAKISDYISPSNKSDFNILYTNLKDSSYQKMVKILFPYEVNSLVQNYIFEFLIREKNPGHKNGHPFIGFGPAKKDKDDK
jgi:hypothetical protein